MTERISSFQNNRVKLVRKLRDKKHRETEHRFVVDYDRDLQRALDCGYTIDFAFHCPELGGLTVDLPSEQVFYVPRDIMEKASYRSSPSPVLAVMHAPPVPHVNDLLSDLTHPVLVLVDLRKPGNIGALLRTADATGFRTILLVDTVLDLYNPNIIRSSTGTCFLRNIYQGDSQSSVDALHANGHTIIATHLEGAVDLYHAPLTDRVAIVLGTEDIGLNADWVKQSHLRVKIPMVGSVSDSLNVSVSGAVVMYETLRQHRAATISNT